MDEDDRPRKLPKLDHDEAANEELGPAMTGAVNMSEDAEQTGALSAQDTTEEKAHEASQPREETGQAMAAESTTQNAPEGAAPPMSKNQLKKLRRQEQWEKSRAQRKDKRKEKTQEKRDRRRQMIEEAREKGGEEAVAALRKTWESTKSRHHRSRLLPLTFVLDCSYDDLMVDKERISLSAQLTRSYSENARAPYSAHLMFTSFNKLLKERFDTVLPGHKNWKGIQLLPEDFAQGAEKAKEQMVPPRGGKLVGPFADQADAKPEDGEVVYLSSDSPDTLTELKPYSTYIIGGLVDKNRHKGICYKHAMEKGIKTAKLPIGDYIQMASRSVLTTNHVVEIMLRWLEVRDWGEAFMKVMPPRKGGKLKERQGVQGENGGDGEEEEEAGEAEVSDGNEGDE
ncbi:tRNA (guanine(9)-N(1))-methyltransferase TRM10 [Penicillium alfredii]|uniref:tRNA (guanine(9)-N1)-methyltransferase n=1 Tax=Penicillium alfredii TaxID=1506179 RepID=A0A9W9GA86_9EURO|nr:tRNA (guanine(9)-N(1))-methyltransferase TRM10 [Penicillium alfredii]KAJ5115014.1 tRNA (guanine(9)-N(1))-methyltransferase TRM10 [Penicillium alfredii]